jgi:2,4-dienoyl-CoA reductase-like NADH-dependent reductase (Old Yellow Enzyme family)/thioredoxin reductase
VKRAARYRRPVRTMHEVLQMNNFEKLFTAGKIGSLEIPNRFAVGPMVTCMNPDGLASEQYIRYHEEKAKGGFGLIITEDYRINENAGGYLHIAGLFNEAQVESHKRLTDVIHKYDTRIFAQIYHAGRQTNRLVNGGVQPVSCSPIACPFNKELPRELTVSEIKGLIEDFARTARNAKRAGFDGIEIHAAHGYLIHQFLSLHANKRIDDYGGCYDNRVRFLREVMTAVRSAVGPDFPMQVRISASDQIDGGYGTFESHRLYRDTEAFGADAIHASYGFYGSRSAVGGVGSYYQTPGYGARFAEEVKKFVRIPVFAVGGIHDPYMAEDILERNAADFITMSRMSLCNPDLPNKVKVGDLADLRVCMRCMQGCIGATRIGEPLRCMINPELGHEFEYNASPVSAPKKILVAGGGVAGMEAARTAARKGHKVILFEAAGTLGGQFLIAAYPPYKGHFSTFPAWQKRQLEKLDVEIRMNTALTPEIIAEERPDKVIVATGARPVIRPHKGLADPKTVYAEEVLCGKRNTGMDAIVIGGGEIGSETAAFLSMQSKASVAITTRQNDIGGNMVGDFISELKEQLARNAVNIFCRTTLKEVTATGVLLETDGKKWAYPCDSVVLAFGTESYNPFAGRPIGDCEVVVVGDALKARNALDAIHEGFLAGYGA